MNPRLEQWVASLRERQIATSISLVCLLLIITVSIWPDIFHSAAPDPMAQASVTPAPEPEPTAMPVVPGPRASASQPAEATVITPPEPSAHENPDIAIAPQKKAGEAHTTHTNSHNISPTKTAPSQTQKPPSLPSGYYIQVGAFSDRQRAQAMQRKISKAGWPVHIMSKDKGLLGVVIGPYPSRKEAGQHQQKILQQLKLKGYPIQHTS